MIFPRIIELQPSTRIELSLANSVAVVYARARLIDIFKFLKSRNRICASFKLLRNLIAGLHLKFLPRLRKNFKDIAFRGRPTATAL